MTVPVLVPPPVTDDGDDDTVCTTDGLTLIFVAWDVIPVAHAIQIQPPPVTDGVLETAKVFTVKVAVVEPAGMVTEAGTVT